MLGIALLKYPDADKGWNDVISQHVTLVANGTHSAAANMECLSVMITDPSPHHDTPSTPSIRLDKTVSMINILQAYATPATDHQHFLNGKGIHQRIAHHANVVISDDDTFQPNVGVHFDVDQLV